MDALPHRLKALAAFTFVAVALLQTWPLPTRLASHTTGLIGGDGGVYLWNVWHFRHRVMELGASPFWTDSILTLGGSANLALHNYSIFADVLALPIQSFSGVVTAFNIAYLVNVALTGFGMFLLAHRLSGRVAEAWLGGLMFAWAPFLVARGASHYSLAAAAPLPFFLYFLDRAWTEKRTGDAAAAGGCAAWAFYCDPYYAVYSAMLLVLYAGSRVLQFTRVSRSARVNRAVRILDGLLLAVSLAIVSIHVVAGGAVTIAGHTVAMRTLYTPMLLVAVLLLARAGMVWRASWSRSSVPANAARLLAALVITAGVFLAPELHALAVMTASDQLVRAPVPWRSSAPGLDVLAFLLPNATHVLAPTRVHEWLAGQPGGFDENVASVSYVAIAVVLLAWQRIGARLDRTWVVITVAFWSLALGPFVTIGGYQTAFPTPWALVRYVPFIGEARMPQRMSIVVFLGLTMLFAAALAALGRAWPERRRTMLVLVGLLLAVELWPAPRPLFAADVPGVFTVIAADRRPLQVLELPFGIRDGLSSFGNFSASSQFFQTFHGKRLIGGYLSRLDGHTQRVYREHPVTRVLMAFGDEASPTPDMLAAARDAGHSFVERTQLGYVVIDTGRTTAEERAFAVDALGLERIDTPAESGLRELYSTDLARR